MNLNSDNLTEIKSENYKMRKRRHVSNIKRNKKIAKDKNIIIACFSEI